MTSPKQKRSRREKISEYYDPYGSIIWFAFQLVILTATISIGWALTGGKEDNKLGFAQFIGNTQLPVYSISMWVAYFYLLAKPDMPRMKYDTWLILVALLGWVASLVIFIMSLSDDYSVWIPFVGGVIVTLASLGLSAFAIGQDLKRTPNRVKFDNTQSEREERDQEGIETSVSEGL